jgi:hypothetical protein
MSNRTHPITRPKIRLPQVVQASNRYLRDHHPVKLMPHPKVMFREMTTKMRKAKNTQDH